MSIVKEQNFYGPHAYGGSENLDSFDPSQFGMFSDNIAPLDATYRKPNIETISVPTIDIQNATEDYTVLSRDLLNRGQWVSDRSGGVVADVTSDETLSNWLEVFKFKNLRKVQSWNRYVQLENRPHSTDLTSPQGIEEWFLGDDLARSVRSYGISPVIDRSFINSSTERIRGYIASKIKSSYEDYVVEFSDAQKLAVTKASIDTTIINGSDAWYGIENARMEERLDTLIAESLDEQFDVGMESKFSNALQQLCGYDPVALLTVLTERISVKNSRSEILCEIMWWASRQNYMSVRSNVIALMSAGLSHRSALVRDAAALSIAALDEDAAKPYLQQAISREVVPELKQDLEDLIRSLGN